MSAAVYSFEDLQQSIQKHCGGTITAKASKIIGKMVKDLKVMLLILAKEKVRVACKKATGLGAATGIPGKTSSGMMSVVACKKAKGLGATTGIPGIPGKTSSGTMSVVACKKAKGLGAATGIPGKTVSGGLQESRQKGHKGNRGRRQSRSQSVTRKGKGWKSGKGKEEKGQRQSSRRPSLNRKGKGSKSKQRKAKGKTSGLEESQNATEHPIGRWKQLKEQEKNLLEQRKEELDQRERANAHWEDLNEEVEKN